MIAGCYGRIHALGVQPTEAGDDQSVRGHHLQVAPSPQDAVLQERAAERADSQVHILQQSECLTLLFK